MSRYKHALLVQGKAWFSFVPLFTLIVCVVSAAQLGSIPSGFLLNDLMTNTVAWFAGGFVAWFLLRNKLPRAW